MLVWSVLIGLSLWSLFAVSQEENTTTSAWCNVGNKTQSFCLRVLLFGDGIQTVSIPVISSHLSQCHSKWPGLPNTVGQNYWGRHTIRVCFGWNKKICFRSGIHQVVLFKKLLTCFIIISVGLGRKGCLVYDMLISIVQCTI